MSRKKKTTKARPEGRPPPLEPELSTDRAVDKTTTAFTSSHAVVEDFRLYCDEELERMDMNVDFGQVAHEIWEGRPGRGPAIVVALADYISACQRHREALLALRSRFDALFNDNVHEHVDPVEPCRDLIRRRLFSPPAP